MPKHVSFNNVSEIIQALLFFPAKLPVNTSRKTFRAQPMKSKLYSSLMSAPIIHSGCYFESIFFDFYFTIISNKGFVFYEPLVYIQ